MEWNYETIVDIIGFIGVALIVIAYFLIQANKITNQQLIFPIMNLIGALLILVSLMVHWNTPSVVIECIWIAISLYGIFSILRKKHKEKRH